MPYRRSIISRAGIVQVPYSGEGENIGTCMGVVELLELVVILLF